MELLPTSLRRNEGPTAPHRSTPQFRRRTFTFTMNRLGHVARASCRQSKKSEKRGYSRATWSGSAAGADRLRGLCRQTQVAWGTRPGAAILPNGPFIRGFRPSAAASGQPPLARRKERGVPRTCVRHTIPVVFLRQAAGKGSWRRGARDRRRGDSGRWSVARGPMCAQSKIQNPQSKIFPPIDTTAPAIRPPGPVCRLLRPRP